MNVFKLKCIELRKRDFTLPEIMKITGRSKTSVYFHIKDVPLSSVKKKQISENSRQRALKVAASRKGISKRPHKTFEEWTPELVLLIGHLMFDGELLKKKCVYNNRSPALIYRFEQCMKLVYDYSSIQYQNPRSGVIRSEYHNVALVNYLYEKAHELLQNIHTMQGAHKREFIRAFFDDEGCMDFRPGRSLRRVRGYQNDRDVLDLVIVLLQDFAIESHFRKPNEVIISGKENLKKFQKEINFSKGVRLNPNRTNSIWKKDIEKRELLDMAIKSFKN